MKNSELGIILNFLHYPEQLKFWSKIYKGLEELSDIILGCKPENIFNDENGCFYRQFLTKSMTLKAEKCKGGKKVKQRLSVLFCCNMKGEKLKFLINE